MQLSTHRSSSSGAQRDGARRSVSQRGFTLAESMIASGIFLMVTLGVYAALIQSYQIEALARCRDDARAVLRTFGDQFERLQSTDEVPVGSGAYYTRWLFSPEISPSYPMGGPTGKGLVWGDLSNSNVVSNPIPATPIPNLAITLGSSAHPVAATLTRDVICLDDSNGGPSPRLIKAAGYLMRGTFSVNFTINKKNYTETLTLVRAVP
jgi:prepilin-type N-terminal cleavage/methylation domain-containing protein